MIQEVQRNRLITALEESYFSPDGLDKESFAMELYRYQYHYNPVYHDYCQWIHREPATVTSFSDIPLLPVSAFKHHVIKTGSWRPETCFRSSGTTSSTRSSHQVRNLNFYLEHSRRIWELSYGPLEDYRFIALLPGYVDRGESSLVYMINHFIAATKHNGSQLVVSGYKELANILNHRSENKKTVLFGVSFALVSFLESNQKLAFEGMIVETGGMKGLRENMTKESLLNLLQNGFGTSEVNSEYGMTELFSQAYSKSLFFQPNPYLHIEIKQIQDPLSPEKTTKQGIVGCIDLANIDTCAFILTEDAGLKNTDGSFSFVGRLDNSDARGCNLLLAEAI